MNKLIDVLAAVTMVVYESVVYLLSRSRLDPAQED